MDQPLFPEETAPATPTTTPVEPSTAPPVPGPNPEVAALQEQVNGLTRNLESLTGTLREALTPRTPEPTEPERVDPNDYLSALANSPQETIRKEAAEVARKQLEESYGTFGNQMVETQHRMLMNDQQRQIDEEFGKGTFAEVYKPKIEKDLETIRKRNPMALANAESMQILVDRVTGQNRTTLNERETQAQTKKQEEWVATRTEIANSLPPAGPRRGSPDGTTPDDDTKLFLAEIEAKTGEHMDPAAFLKLMGAGNKIEDWERVQKEGSK